VDGMELGAVRDVCLSGWSGLGSLLAGGLEEVGQSGKEFAVAVARYRLVAAQYLLSYFRLHNRQSRVHAYCLC
jgi:hypothetical protein